MTPWKPTVSTNYLIDINRHGDAIEVTGETDVAPFSGVAVTVVSNGKRNTASRFELCADPEVLEALAAVLLKVAAENRENA